jgi:hypothetical protein
MKPHRRNGIFLKRALLCALLVVSGGAIRASLPTSCEVATPGACESPNHGKTEAARTVRRLSASSEGECIEQARALTESCARLFDGKAEVTARFRTGPVDTVRQIAPSKEQALVAAPRLPIVYGKNFEAEFQQYGYSPKFAPGVVNFFGDGLVRVRSQNYLQTQLRNGGWSISDFAALATAAISKVPDVASFDWIWDSRSAYSDDRIYVDTRGYAYTLIQGGRTRLKGGKSPNHRPYLLFTNNGSSWSALAIPLPDDRQTWRARIEYNDGNTDNSEPPPILLYDRNEDIKKRSSRLFLYVPVWSSEKLTLREPTLISERSLLQENHSGGANSTVSFGGSIYIVYPGSEAVPERRGTPSYMSIYNRKDNTVQSETLIGFAGTAAAVDNHNIPGACVGINNTIHVLLPGHQEPLRLLSGKVEKSSISWTSNVLVGEEPRKAGGYTYGSLNCDRSGNVYIVSRWAGDDYRFQLVFLHRRPDGQWVSWSGRQHRVLVDPGRAFYAAWRQKVTLDSSGSLYLFYSYYVNQLTKDEIAKLRWRFPFEAWAEVKESVPRLCVKAEDARCWLHPMPELTKVLLRSEDLGRSWQFVQ